jgi:hypothetical protein
MEKEILFEIAKIIDNEFISKRESFSAKRKDGYWYLSTNKCDMASFIKVFETNNKIYSIKVLGDYTDGWQDIHSETWARIMNYLKTLNSKVESAKEVKE